MQTFLPYRDFYESAKCLDYQRLGKQRVETKQILNALLGRSKGWTNHPATRMWRGSEVALTYYGSVMCAEWTARGYKDTCGAFFVDLGEQLREQNYSYKLPDWYKDKDISEMVCASHRSNLLRKRPDFYGKYGWTETPDMPYVWPVNS